MTDTEIVEAVVIIAGFFAAVLGFIVALNLVIIDMRHRIGRRRGWRRSCR